MIFILIAIVVSAIIAVALIWYGANDMDGLGFISGTCGVLLAIAAGITAVIYAFACWSWIAAGTKAEIINREYGKSYTREEVFYASDVIDTIRELERKRIELNGDLMREKDGEE